MVQQVDQIETSGRFESDLAAIAHAGDREAFVRLFRHFAPRVKSYLLGLGAPGAEAEELAQEVMVKVWRRASSYDPSKAAASTWIFTIARNQAIDAFRRGARPEIEPEDPLLVGESPPSPDEAYQAVEQAGRLRRALAALPEEQLDIVRLSYFDERPQTRIARELGVPLGTVKSRLRLALGRLRQALDLQETKP